MFQDDFVLRAAKQIAAVLARVMGLRQQGEHEEADRELDGLYRGLVPFDPELLELLDSRTLASMIGDPARLRALCQVLLFDADGAAERGTTQRARRKWLRALELLQHGVPELTDEDRNLIEVLHGRLQGASGG